MRPRVMKNAARAVAPSSTAWTTMTARLGMVGPAQRSGGVPLPASGDFGVAHPSRQKCTQSEDNCGPKDVKSVAHDVIKHEIGQ